MMPLQSQHGTDVPGRGHLPHRPGVHHRVTGDGEAGQQREDHGGVLAGTAPGDGNAGQPHGQQHGPDDRGGVRRFRQQQPAPDGHQQRRHAAAERVGHGERAALVRGGKAQGVEGVRRGRGQDGGPRGPGWPDEDGRQHEDARGKARHGHGCHTVIDGVQKPVPARVQHRCDEDERNSYRVDISSPPPRWGVTGIRQLAFS